MKPGTKITKDNIWRLKGKTFLFQTHSEDLIDGIIRVVYPNDTAELLLYDGSRWVESMLSFGGNVPLVNLNLEAGTHILIEVTEGA